MGPTKGRFRGVPAGQNVGILEYVRSGNGTNAESQVPGRFPGAGKSSETPFEQAKRLRRPVTAREPGPVPEPWPDDILRWPRGRFRAKKKGTAPETVPFPRRRTRYKD